jgi:hypothetical protein
MFLEEDEAGRDFGLAGMRPDQTGPDAGGPLIARLCCLLMNAITL